MVRQLRMDLPIEIVQQGSNAPLLFVLAQPLRIGNNARLDRKRMFPQSFGLSEFADNIPSLFTSQHEFHDNGSNLFLVFSALLRKSHASAFSLLRVTVPSREEGGRHIVFHAEAQSPGVSAENPPSSVVNRVAECFQNKLYVPGRRTVTHCADAEILA